MDYVPRGEEIPVPRAALIAGIGILIMAVAAPLAEFVVYPTLVVPGGMEATIRNMDAHQALFLGGIFAYLVTFILDLVVAWALLVLLAPVNRWLSLLAAWFRVAYTVVAFVAFLNFVTVFRLVRSPEYMSAVGSEQFNAQVHLLLNAFRHEWGMGMLLFGIHLGLLAYLVYRSGYIPRLLGLLLGVNGLGYLVYELKPYLYPDAELGFVMITFFGELIFMLWLLARGWAIPASVGRD